MLYVTGLFGTEMGEYLGKHDKQRPQADEKSRGSTEVLHQQTLADCYIYAISSKSYAKKRRSQHTLFQP
jgi:hypothetical protein